MADDDGTRREEEPRSSRRPRHPRQSWIEMPSMAPSTRVVINSSSTHSGEAQDIDAEAIEASMRWTDSVDRVVDTSPCFVTAVRSAFIRYQDPKSSTISANALLPALQLLFQKATKGLDPKVGRLLFRSISREDLVAIAEQDPDINIYQSMDIIMFSSLAKRVLKRVLADRGKRLGLFVLGGIVLVHAIKGLGKGLNIIGPTVGAFLSSLVPTVLIGPAVGIAGALYM